MGAGLSILGFGVSDGSTLGFVGAEFVGGVVLSGSFTVGFVGADELGREVGSVVAGLTGRCPEVGVFGVLPSSTFFCGS